MALGYTFSALFWLAAIVDGTLEGDMIEQTQTFGRAQLSGVFPLDTASVLCVALSFRAGELGCGRTKATEELIDVATLVCTKSCPSVAGDANTGWPLER